MITSKTNRAKTVTILLGDEELNCLVLPDGQYRISATQLADFFLVPQKHSSRDFKAILPKGFEFPKEYTDTNNRAIPLLDLTSVGIIALALAFKGNKLAQAYCVANNAEAMERRIDAAINVIRTEKERNERYTARRDGILSRNFWTDVIDNYMKTHEVSDNYRKFVYHNVSDTLNLALFGLRAKQVREHYDLPSGISIRDYVPSETLKLLDTIEKAAGVRVDNNEVCPKQALKDVIGLLGIEPSQDRL